MHRFIKGLRYMTRSDWFWLHAKLALSVMCPIMTFINPPMAVSRGLVGPAVMNLVIFMILSGGLVSSLGILLRGTRSRPMLVGYAFEIAGLVPLICGPFLIAGVYLVVASNQDTPTTLIGFAFTYSLGALLLARLVDIQQHHLASKRTSKRELRRRSR